MITSMTPYPLLIKCTAHCAHHPLYTSSYFLGNSLDFYAEGEIQPDQFQDKAFYHCIFCIYTSTAQTLDQKRSLCAGIECPSYLLQVNDVDPPCRKRNYEKVKVQYTYCTYMWVSIQQYTVCWVRKLRDQQAIRIALPPWARSSSLISRSS